MWVDPWNKQRQEEIADKASLESGSEQATAAFVRKYSRWLRATVRSCLRYVNLSGKELEEDLLQEVWLDIFSNQAVSKWEPSQRRLLRTFLMVRARLRTTALLRTGTKRWRQEHLRPPDVLDRLALTDEPLVEDRWFCAHLDNAQELLERDLKEPDREIVRLRLEGLPVKDIAAKLKLPVARITKRLQRVRQRLAQIHAERLLYEGQDLCHA